jgi:hypothetical protein
MLIRKVISKVIGSIFLAGLVFSPAVAFASAEPSRPPCIFNEYRVTSVKPYKVDERIGWGTVQRLAGAQLYVVAEPGLTREWLQLKLERHLLQMRQADMRDCAFDLADVRVEVDSAGGGFWVKLIAKDFQVAKEVLRRASFQVGP